MGQYHFSEQCRYKRHSDSAIDRAKLIGFGVFLSADLLSFASLILLSNSLNGIAGYRRAALQVLGHQ